MGLRDDLIRDEGSSLLPYKDTASPPNWTIGVGHDLGPSVDLLGRAVPPRMTRITDSEERALLTEDIGIAQALAEGLVGPLPIGPRGDAVVNIAFNLGGRLAEFVNFIAAYKAQDWVRAAAEMLRSAWAVEVGERAIRLHDAVLNNL